ncbi:unnamed protein product [Rotaria sp. Silwood2]|nr:unnamed protein product [Rotaria sp. Silwood2]
MGIYVDDDQTIYIVDTDNHRIVEWKSDATSGQAVAGDNGQGNRADQLNYPRDVIVDKETDSLIICDQGNRRVMRWSRQNRTSGEIIIDNIDCFGLTMDDQRFLYVSDQKKHEVRRYKMGEMNEVVVAGGNKKGDRLDQLYCPTFIFVDQDYSVYVSDWNNNRVMKWKKDTKEGIIVAGGKGEGNALNQLSAPKGVFVDELGTTYVADWGNDRVMRWCKGATHGDVIVGGNGSGKEANQLNCPIDLSFDRHGNLQIENHFNTTTNVNLILSSQKHHHFIVVFIIIGIHVTIICLLALYILYALRCMTNQAGTVISLSTCIFELNINDPIPDDVTLSATFSDCAIHEADSMSLLGHTDGSCYSEVSIDYNTQKMKVYLTHVTGLQSFSDPYDNMLGFANGIKSVVQYKIAGNLEQAKIQMTTRIQCKTSDNCALDKLRNLLSNLTITETRLDIFKKIIGLLDTSDSIGISGLSCIKDDIDVQCENNEHHCIFSFSKGHSLRKDCAMNYSHVQYDIEYRFNIIEEISNYGIDNSHNAFKFFYLCNSDFCNNDGHVVKVDHLLYSFALASLTNDKINNTNTNYNQPSPQISPTPPNKIKSNKQLGGKPPSIYENLSITYYIEE